MMEPLSNIRTIVGITQDILAALETASRNKSRCGRIANRVRRLRDVLLEMDGSGTTSDAAMRKGLEEALSNALEQVRRCQRSGFFRSLIVAGGRMSDPLDEVEREIDRCLLDLGAAGYARIARLEALLRQLNVAATASTDDDDGEKEDKKADRVPLGSGVEKNHEEDATAAEDVTAIGVPVCTVTAGVHEHGHEIVTLPQHGYYGCCNCYRRFCHGHGTCDCWHDYAGCPSDAASCYTQYSPSPPSMFSDDNPNACTII
ncbi:unnamed protein product [Urochloa decumbens]|uniref:Uncharacterized protein n=1 Tax=Urochloa decumbens TaxID=240449 RepID=A0ABC9GHP7_9POAL